MIKADMNAEGSMPTVPDGVETIGGKDYMRDGRGSLTPVELVRPQDKLQDDVVRKILGYAIDLSGQVRRFKVHTFDDISAFEAILAEHYDAKLGGAKGNKTLMSFDGLFKITVQVADQFDFGPELQVAKDLTDECLNEWAADARPEIRSIVTRAFNTDKQGQINRAEIYRLLRLEIGDARWLRAMEAIKDAMRVIGTSTYVRCYRRACVESKWEHVQIDLAKV